MKILYPVRWKTMTRPGSGYRPTVVERRQPKDMHRELRIRRAESAGHFHYTPDVEGVMVPASRAANMAIARFCNRCMENA